MDERCQFVRLFKSVIEVQKRARPAIFWCDLNCIETMHFLGFYPIGTSGEIFKAFSLFLSVCGEEIISAHSRAKIQTL